MNTNPNAAPVEAAGIVSANLTNTTDKDNPLVKVWMKRIKASEKHFKAFHQRVRYNRELVRGIDDKENPQSPAYNKKRANLIKSTLSVVLSKVYAKNPEMSAEPTNKNGDLRLLATTVSTVTQTMLEDAKLKSRAKRMVRQSMTTTFGVLKVQYQYDMKTDPQIKDRIEDTQDNLAHIEQLIKSIEDGDDQSLVGLETRRAELQEAIAGLEAKKETVAAEGLTLDLVRTDRLLLDESIEDIQDYEQSSWIIEKIPMRRSKAKGLFTELENDDWATASTFKIGNVDEVPESNGPYASNLKGGSDEDPMVLVYEAWSKVDNRIYTLIDGISCKFARAPYSPQFTGERWWPYFILPFGVVDGCMVTQSLVDDLEKLEVEHNETRDKFAEVRRNIKPGFITSADVKESSITTRQDAQIGEVTVIDTGGESLKDHVQERTQLKIDPAVYDTSTIAYDIEAVSGLQEAARSVVTTAKTATEATISDQSLGARVDEFRNHVEDTLTEVAQYSSELCLLAMTRPQVAQIMGEPKPLSQEDAMNAVMMGKPPQPEPTYAWPEDQSPEYVFSLIQMKIRAGTTAAPNKLAAQEAWTRALPVLQGLIDKILQVEAMGGDGTPYRELVKETAARFDESIDVDRFLPAKPQQIPQIPGAQPGMPMPGGLPGQSPATLQ